LRNKRNPVVVFLADYPNWAFDYVARSISRRISHRFKTRIEYVARKPNLDPRNIDILYVFFWGEQVYRNLGFKRGQLVKEVASWRWKYEEKYGMLSSSQFCEKYLDDCICVTTPAASIYTALSKEINSIVHCPNGVEHEFYSSSKKISTTKSKHLRIGWVGNPEDACKGLVDILLPATQGYDFKYTNGRLTRSELVKFYSEIDVLAIASYAESQPLPLLESMAAGCFPVTTNVGIVPEIIINGVNGLVVERSPEAFRNAFLYCYRNLDKIRNMRKAQQRFAATQSWDIWALRFVDLFDIIINYNARSDNLPNNKLSGVVNRLDQTSFHSRSMPDDRGDKLSAKSIRLPRLFDCCLDSFNRLLLGDRYTRSLRDRLSDLSCKLLSGLRK
jgi:glycosyltransferase involved in cell wall biosynthesis